MIEHISIWFTSTLILHFKQMKLYLMRLKYTYCILDIDTRKTLVKHNCKKEKYINFLKTQTYCINFYYEYKKK